MQANNFAPVTGSLSTRCCIVGGGPAGIVLAYLLARSGIEVTVLEKWPDFFRDFRGDTIHPSTMEVLRELGILERFLVLKHNETRQMVAHIGGEETVVADFSHLPLACPFIAFIPQWDFLNFMVAEAQKFPAFHLYTEMEVTDVIDENGIIKGVKGKSPKGSFEINAELTCGCDGRHSTVREKAGLTVLDLGAPIDVLWFRLTQKEKSASQSFGYIDYGKIMIMLDRDDYWQCGFIINKGDFDRIKSRGLEAFRNNIAELAPFVAGTVNEINDWEKVKTLTVKVDRLKEWFRPGLICIGDAAHAMSPVGGVGINLAIQDAVAAANILVPAFQKGAPVLNDLRAIQQRRVLPAKLTQRMQVFIHSRVVIPLLHRRGHLKRPLLIRLVGFFPFLARIPARIVGIGFRPEHINI